MMRATWIPLGLVGLVVAVPSCWDCLRFRSGSPDTEAGSNAFEFAADASWRLPPVGLVTRQRPLLVNYHHMALPEGKVSRKEERFAQWNMLILSHDNVHRERLSLARIRQTHPGILLLAWVPLQGPHDGLSPGVPRRGANDWYARDAEGNYVRPHWGGHLMNPWVQDYAWPRHVIRYVEQTCLGPNGYDGVMIDCLWEGPPGQMDVNGDAAHDQQDTRDWQTAVMWMLRTLRQRHPETIIIGNGGGPWSDQCPYVEFANGCMHENALGDQFGGVDWQPMWDGIERNLRRIQTRPAFHLLAVDVRAGGRDESQARRIRHLDPDDLRRFRLGLGTSLLRDEIHFGFDRGDCLHGQLWWFDEYDVDLGPPLAPYESDPFGPGTLQRRFTNGRVVVNPTDAHVSARLPEPLRDATTGTVARAIEIPARDARLLVRPAPEAPRE
jgi:hypothetical protein